MSLHARRRIVLAVVERLTGLPTTGNRVHAGRAAPAPVASTPYLLVYARREQSAPITAKGPQRKLQREPVLAIEAVTASADDDDALADTIAAEVEAAMAADPTLGGICRDLYLSSTNLDARAEGETRTGRTRLEFTVTYFTAADRPDESL